MWDSKEFKVLVERRFGQQRVEEVGIHIGSAVWKFMLARYHSAEAKAWFRKFLSEGVTNEAFEAVKHIFMAAGGMEEAQTFLEGQIYGEAHLIAFAQALHSIADIFSHVIYLGLDLETAIGSPLREERRSLQNVKELMSAKSFAPAVTFEIEATLASAEFRYLTAYVNTTKHRRLLSQHYSANVVPGAERHGVEISGFKFGSEQWPDKWANEFLDTSYAAVEEHFYRVGNAMNSFLS